MATQPAHWRFTVCDYHQMAEAGILTEDDRVELIDGEIVEMSPIGGRHMECVNRLTRLLVRAVGDDALVSIQGSVRLDLYDEPQPDAAVVRDRSYGDDPPAPEDVLLLVEVSHTSLGYDRSRKLPLYAQAGIAEVWIVDVEGARIERHTDPSGGMYRTTVRGCRGEEVESLAVPGLDLRVDEVLP